ncbi:FtsX-like permease family protein [Sphingomonas sp. G124]|uniref:FtsX-like permease family protein n=1 Tax=Sphingomonas cremea TaxID=2904799 RepID=A0A9X1QMZ9_9SPHN|nr:FtsX-like permease family protein [Sphingomonas cremea]MCF2515112.1 FtsX-like permease family protein [Sphingomonas cremea]
MKLPLRLALRDLRGGLSGLGLLWLCLAVAIAGLASVTSLASSVDSAIAANGRQLLGGDLMLSVAQRDAGADERAAIDALGRSSKSVTTRAMLVAPQCRSLLAELSSIDANWPLAGKVEWVGGSKRPAGAEVAIGHEISERLDIGIGDDVRIGRATYRVSAIIDKMPRASGFAFAPPALMDEAGLAKSGLIQPGSLSSTSYRIVLPPASDADAAGKAFQKRFPEGGWRSTTRDEAGSGTRRFIDRLSQMLLLVALSALAIGGLGMSSATAAFAASRRSTIAILKLVGAGRSTVNAMLLAEIGLIAGLAILVGLAAGAMAPALVGKLTAALLPVAPDTSPQWVALGQAALFGVLISFAASWRMVANAGDTRPARLLRGDVVDGEPLRWQTFILPASALATAAAIAIGSASDPWFAATGLAGIAVLCVLFALLGLAIRRIARGAKHLGSPITRLGIAALDRPGAATGRLAVSLGLGLTLLVTLAGTASSILAEIDTAVPRRAPALFLVDIPRAEEPKFRTIAASELPGADLRLVPSLRGPVTEVNGVRVADMRNIPEGAWILRGDRGLTFARDLPPANRIVAGQWWPKDYRGPPLVSIDVDAATALNLKVGDTLTVAILGRPIEARIASMREIDWRSLGFNFAIIFAPGAIEAAPYTLMATASPANGRSTTAFERRLTTELPMVSAIRVSDVVVQVKTLLESIDGAVRIATGFAILMGMIVLAGSVVATRRQRSRDIVLLRLVGATRGQVARSQLIEFVLLSSVVAVAAFASGAIAAWLVVVQLFEFPFSPDWASLALIPLGAIFLAVLAAFAAAIPALNARPAQGLREL